MVSQRAIDETAAVVKQNKIDRDREEQREIFNGWFTDLLNLSMKTPGSGPLGTCLFRDVVRKSKEEMFEKWMLLRPVG